MKNLTSAQLVLCVLCFTSKGICDSLSYELRTLARTSVHVVTVNLNESSLRLDLSLAKGLPAGDEPFPALIAKTQPLAAINGTFFSKQSLKPTGDLVKDGKVVNFGGMGTALAVDAGNNVTFERVQWGKQMDWSSYETVLGCGPSLILRGHPGVDAEIEGFSDSHVLNAGTRSAVGVDQWKRLKLVCVPAAITLSRLSAIMQQLGCTDAMNLDGGASTALYYRGKTIVAPQRKLTNLLIVCRRTSRSSSAPAKTAKPADTSLIQGSRQKETQQRPSPVAAEEHGSGAVPAERLPENPSTAATQSSNPAASAQEAGNAREAEPGTSTGLAASIPSLPAERAERESKAEKDAAVPGGTTPPSRGDSNVTVLNHSVPLKVIQVAGASVMVLLAMLILIATREISMPQPMNLGMKMGVYLAALPLNWLVGMAVFSYVYDFLSGGPHLLSQPHDLALASVAIAVPVLISVFFGTKDITNTFEVGMWTALAVGLACYANGRLHLLDWQFHLAGWRLVVAPIPSGLIVGGLTGFLKRRIAKRGTLVLSA